MLSRLRINGTVARCWNMVRLRREGLSHESPSLLQGCPAEHQLDTHVVTPAELSLKVIQDASLPRHVKLTLSSRVQLDLKLIERDGVLSQLAIMVAAAVDLGLQFLEV